MERGGTEEKHPEIPISTVQPSNPHTSEWNLRRFGMQSNSSPANAGTAVKPQPFRPIGLDFSRLARVVTVSMNTVLLAPAGLDVNALVVTMQYSTEGAVQDSTTEPLKLYCESTVTGTMMLPPLATLTLRHPPPRVSIPPARSLGELMQRVCPRELDRNPLSHNALVVYTGEWLLTWLYRYRDGYTLN